MADFVQEVRNEFSHEFPIFGFNFLAEIAMHVWRDGEMFRRQWIVGVEIMKFFWLSEVTVDYVPRVAVSGNTHQIKLSNFLR